MIRRLFCLGLLAAICSPTSARDHGVPFRPSPNTPSDSEKESRPANLIEGFTEPYADINLAAAEMGTLASVTVRDGDEVTQGQVVASLDNSVLKAALQVAKAGMQAEGDLQAAQAQFDLKNIELQKLSDLYRRNHASQQELDRIRSDVQVAAARLKSVQEDLNVRRLESVRIEAQLRQREIRATIDGVVVDVRKDRGEFVSPSDPVVARIVQLDPLLVVFSVPNNFRQAVQAGQTVDMQIGQHPSTAQGHVEYVSPTADASSGTFRVKVKLPNPERIWHGGEKSVLLLDSPLSLPTPAQKLATAPQEQR